MPKFLLPSMLLLLVCWGCSPPAPTVDAGAEIRPCGELGEGVQPLADISAPVYAEGFSLRPLGVPTDGRVGGSGPAIELTVGETWGSGGERRFWLVPCGAGSLSELVDSESEGKAESRAEGEGNSSSGRVPDGVVVITVPVQSLATTSTTELPHLAELGALGNLVGHAGLDFVYDRRVRERIEAGEVTSLGNPSALDIERLLVLAPELLFVDAAGDGFLADLELLEQAGIAVVPVPAYREGSALARSEWIRFIALFVGRDAQAQEIFDGIESRYSTLRQKVVDQIAPEERPQVLIGAPWNDTWWVPGGNSSTGRLLADAGGSYFSADTESDGNIPLDIERVVEMAEEAEVWLHPGQWRSRPEILSADPRLGRFQAFGEGNVWAHDRRHHNRGSDYYESGVLWADRVLADYVAILHPDLLPEHEYAYHRRLTDEPPPADGEEAAKASHEGSQAPGE